MRWVREQLELCFDQTPGRLVYELVYKVQQKWRALVGATILGGIAGAFVATSTGLDYASCLGWGATAGFLLGIYLAAWLTARGVFAE